MVKYYGERWAKKYGKPINEEWFDVLQKYRPEHLADAMEMILDKHVSFVPTLNEVRAACIACYKADQHKRNLESQTQRVHEMLQFKPTQAQRDRVQREFYPRIRDALGWPIPSCQRENREGKI